MIMAKSKSDTDTAEPGLENLDKVRELLFGSQLGAVESKISSTEKQLGLELRNLNTQTQTNIDALEKFTREELDALAEQIAEERNRREDQGDDLQGALDRTGKDFDRQLSALEDKLATTAKTLREQTHDSIKELREQTQQQIQSVQNFIKDTDARISEERVHRNVLAGLFRDVASQLDDESIGDVNGVVKATGKVKPESSTKAE